MYLTLTSVIVDFLCLKLHAALSFIADGSTIDSLSC